MPRANLYDHIVIACLFGDIQKSTLTKIKAFTNLKQNKAGNEIKEIEGISDRSAQLVHVSVWVLIGRLNKFCSPPISEYCRGPFPPTSNWCLVHAHNPGS